MKTAIIILAAGAATRMQKVKQLLPYQKTTLLEHAITTAKHSLAQITICVLGAHKTIIKEKIQDTAITINNTEWESGMGSSVAKGVQAALALAPDVDAVVFTLADQPFVTSAFLNLLQEKAVQHPSNIIAARYQQTLGVPVLFPKKYFKDLLELTGEQGAKKLLSVYSAAVIAVIPDFENIDIDTPEDYLKL